MTIEPPLLLTYQQAGDLLQLSDRTVWTMVRDGLIAACKMGRSVRIDRRDLEAFIARSKLPRKIS